jgi:propionyl-CoA synthetase
MAAVLRSLGVQPGDRVLLYMPMVAEAVFAVLACARIGAIHSVVFGGFASSSLAHRIDDATPKVIVSADAGSRGGKAIAYKPMLDEALRTCRHQPAAVLLVDRGLAPMPMEPGRDLSWRELREAHAGAEVPCVWVEATHPSYTLYTSGTTGSPRASSATRAAMPWRWPRACATSSWGSPARPSFAPATSAGSWGTATSSTAP